MNIYTLCSTHEIETDLGADIIYNYDYVTHEKLFTKEQFSVMCKECLSKCSFRCNYELKNMLVKEYGFKKLNEVCEFEFSEVEDNDSQ